MYTLSDLRQRTYQNVKVKKFPSHRVNFRGVEPWSKMDDPGPVVNGRGRGVIRTVSGGDLQTDHHHRPSVSDLSPP